MVLLRARREKLGSAQVNQLGVAAEFVRATTLAVPFQIVCIVQIAPQQFSAQLVVPIQDKHWRMRTIFHLLSKFTPLTFADASKNLLQHVVYQRGQRVFQCRKVARQWQKPHCGRFRFVLFPQCADQTRRKRRFSRPRPTMNEHDGLRIIVQKPVDDFCHQVFRIFILVLAGFDMKRPVRVPITFRPAFDGDVHGIAQRLAPCRFPRYVVGNRFLQRAAQQSLHIALDLVQRVLNAAQLGVHLVQRSLHPVQKIQHHAQLRGYFAAIVQFDFQLSLFRVVFSLDCGRRSRFSAGPRFLCDGESGCRVGGMEIAAARRAQAFPESKAFLLFLHIGPHPPV